ncbi:MAG: hypothetical protein AB8G05_11445 [Oligoflexales bacterium]
MAKTSTFQISYRSGILVFHVLVLSFLFIQCNPSSSQGTGRAGSTAPIGEEENPLAKNGEETNKENSSGLYQDMPLGELMLLEQERKNQDLAEEDELFLLDAINSEFCRKLEEKQKNCPAIKRLIFDPTESKLRCDGQKTTSDIAPKIEVTIPNTKSGSFVLLANDIYKSSPFGPGSTEITFSSESGGEFQAPPFIKVYKLVLRSYDSAGQLKKLPSIESFNVKITVDGNELLDDYAAPSEDTVLKAENKEYRIPVNDIINLRKSSKCLVDQNQINALRTTITNGITADQVFSRKQEYKKARENLNYDIADRSGKRASLIEDIFKHQTSIEFRFPILEKERNRQFKLVNELKTDVQIGCQYMQPIQSFEIELEGSMNSNVRIGVEDSQRPDDLQDGTATELLLDFGGVKFSVDFSNQNIFGIRYPLEKDVSEEAIIGELDRIYIRKKGASYADTANEVSCSNGANGIWAQAEQAIKKAFYDEICFDIREEGVFFISEITIWVNGETAFSRSDLGIALDHKTRKWSGDLQSNEKWIQLMLNEKCDAIN